MPKQPIRFYMLLAWVSIMPVLGSLTISSLLFLDTIPLPTGFDLQLLLTIIVMIVLMSFALAPTTFLAIVSGFLLGWKAIPVVLVSYVLAAAFGFQIAQFINQDSLMTYVKSSEKRKTFFLKLQGKDFLLTIFSRLSPVLPFAVMNVTLASLQVNFRKYLLGSIIGMFPRTIISIYIGVESENITSSIEGGEWNLTKIIVLTSLLIISSWGIKKVLDQNYKSV